MVLDFGGGSLFTQIDVRETPFGVGGGGAVPIGGISSWLKNMAGVPALPAEWVECNGQTLSDANSPLNGQVIPDLNGDNRFLRGNSSSGGTGGSSTHSLTTAELASHTHSLSSKTIITAYILDSARYPDEGIFRATAWGTGHATSAQGSGDAHENKPPYYNVVWIMRVK